MRRFALLVLLTTSVISIRAQSVQAHDPAFGFMFGYSLGQASQFQNRLPAPPYFAVYPPVYYGARYARPYGESPFASWPLLTAGDDYRPRPAQTPVTFTNPHASGSAPCTRCAQPTAEASDVTAGKFVTMDNPFVTASSTLAAK
jgi:hypothetical protein